MVELALWILNLLLHGALFAPQPPDRLTKVDQQIFQRGTLEYWINYFDFEIPVAVRDGGNFKPRKRVIHFDSSKLLDNETQKVAGRHNGRHSEYNSAYFAQREGKRLKDYSGRGESLFAFDGNLNHSNFGILGDTLGEIKMVTVGYDFDTKTEYFYDNGKLDLIVVKRNEAHRTSWDAVSHEINQVSYYFGGMGLFAIERYHRGVEGDRKRYSTILTKDLGKLSDSLQRKADKVLRLAKYIVKAPGVTCPARKPQRIMSPEELTAYFGREVSLESRTSIKPGNTSLFIDFEIDTNGNVTKILDDRALPGTPPYPLKEEVKRVLLKTKWKPAMAGCKPRVDKLTLMPYFENGKFTGVSVS